MRNEAVDTAELIYATSGHPNREAILTWHDISPTIFFDSHLGVLGDILWIYRHLCWNGFLQESWSCLSAVSVLSQSLNRSPYKPQGSWSSLELSITHQTIMHSSTTILFIIAVAMGASSQPLPAPADAHVARATSSRSIVVPGLPIARDTLSSGIELQVRELPWTGAGAAAMQNQQAKLNNAQAKVQQAKNIMSQKKASAKASYAKSDKAAASRVS